MWRDVPPAALRLASIATAGIDREVAERSADGACTGRNAAAVGEKPVHARKVLSIAPLCTARATQSARKFEIGVGKRGHVARTMLMF